MNYNGEEISSTEWDAAERRKEEAENETFKEIEETLSDTCKECFRACVDQYVNEDSPRSQWCVFGECEYYEGGNK